MTVAEKRRRQSEARRHAAEQATKPVPFSVVDLDTGRILRVGSAPARDLAAQAKGAREKVVAGLLDTAKRVDLEALAQGKLVLTDRPVRIRPEQVRAEAERRILERYPIWKQMNLIRVGDAAMGAYIDAVRAASNELEAADPIPADFRDDRHWPNRD